MNRTKVVRNVFIFTLSLFLNSCASELSDQDRAREQALLDFERLSAAKGTYHGLLEFADQGVPCTLDVLVQYNPSGNQNIPVLQATLRVGFFAGTQVVSRESSFNFANSELKFGFPSASAGIKSELRGFLIQKGELAVSLETPKGYRASGILRTDATPLFNTSPKQNWQLRIVDEETEIPGVFQLTQTFQQIAAPAGSDLPEMAELDGSILFSHFAKTPTQTTSIIYSPLSQQMDIRFANGTRLFFRNISVGKNEKLTFPAKLEGELILRDARQFRVTASASPVVIAVPLLPPERFIGYYQAKPNSLIFPTVAYLQYRNSTGANPETFPFSRFPNLRLSVLICWPSEGEKTLNKKLTLDLASVDFLLNRAVFQTLDAAVAKESLAASYKNDWSLLEGYFETSGSGSGGSRPFLSLTPNSSIGTEGCKEL